MAKKCINVKKARDGTCPDSALDIFSFGHVLFGLMLASLYLLITIQIAQQNEIYKAMVMGISFAVSLGASVVWEVLERTIVSEYIYKRSFGQKRWCESTKNSLADIIIVVVCFYIVFVPGMMYITNTLQVFILIIVLQVPILIFVWIIKRRC